MALLEVNEVSEVQKHLLPYQHNSQYAQKTQDLQQVLEPGR
jgi:hypothetical protein